MTGPTLVSVVLSFRNEAANIPALVSRLDAVLAGERLPYELIFVNDASTDGSAESVPAPPSAVTVSTGPAKGMSLPPQTSQSPGGRSTIPAPLPPAGPHRDLAAT